MTREFIMMPEFDRQWHNMELGDNELRQLQESLLDNPKAGKVIWGTIEPTGSRTAQNTHRLKGTGKKRKRQSCLCGLYRPHSNIPHTAYPKNEMVENKLYWVFT